MGNHGRMAYPAWVALVVLARAKPKAVGWVYLADPGESPDWDTIAFHAMDLLLVGPMGLQQCDWTPHRQRVFPYRPLFNCEASFGVNASLLHRFEALIHAARRRNPALEIMAAQWYASDFEAPLETWGGSLGAMGPQVSDEELEGYATKVHAFLEHYNLSAYVLDYEGTNVMHWYPRLLVKLAKAFRDGQGQGRGIGLSPGTAEYLKGTNSLTDYVFLQSYTPGVNLAKYLEIFDSSKVFVGLCPFHCDGHISLETAQEMVEQHHLAGIHVWRLNDGNQQSMLAENGLMRQVGHAAAPKKRPPSSGFFNLADALEETPRATAKSGLKAVLAVQKL